ncbi:MAG: hypothetical protein ABFR75_07195 [Acidobacteriota bacterium]
MENLRNVLIFTGNNIRGFIIYIFINFIYISFFLSIIILLFFLTLRSTRVDLIFFSGLIFLLIANWYVRRKFFFKFQFEQNFKYLKFIKEKNNKHTELPSAKDMKQIKGDVRSKLRNSGMIFLFLNTIVSLTTLTVYKYDSFPSQRGLLNKINLISIKLFITGHLLYVILSAPFVIISFFFTMGMSFRIKSLVFIIAFIFAYFVKLSVLDPILSLIHQKETDILLNA